MSYALILIITDILQSLKLKDPCKKCLLKVCCSEICEEKEKVNRFIFPQSSVRVIRYMAWLSITSTVICISTIIISIIKS